ncbi:MAG: MmgE/PrpD family protein [Burkholderiales bacterium]
MGTPSIAEQLAERVAALDPQDLPTDLHAACEDLLIDVGGLCVAARHSEYMKMLVESVDRGGACTAIGHAGSFSAADAAMLNGTATHGEDFDDTFEGGPVHSGAVVVPAVLAACERFDRDGAQALLGIAVGVETMCRLSLVAPKKTHDAGFHPTAVLGAMGATLGVAACLGLNQKQTVDALGNAGSMAGGIIEYLAEGAWTKRLHAGWAAHVGVHAARVGQSGFLGPRTVFEGTHGFFNAFAHTPNGDFNALLDGFGADWLMKGLTFKPYATGTMNQPYIDCALRLAQNGFKAEEVAEVVCETAEGYVKRLWEPLASKHRPANDYAAKFSTPFNIAVAFVTGGAGFEAFTERTVRDPRILDLTGKVRYIVDPNNPYPKRYTGHIRMTLKDGRVFEERQPHIRGGREEPLTREDIRQKFRGNARYGGWSDAEAESFLRYAGAAFESAVDLARFRA